MIKEQGARKIQINLGCEINYPTFNTLYYALQKAFPFFIYQNQHNETPSIIEIGFHYDSAITTNDASDIDGGDPTANKLIALIIEIITETLPNSKSELV